MSLRKRKARDWELFPPRDGVRPPKYKFCILKEVNVNPLYYYTLDKSRQRRCIKPRNVKFVQQNIKLQRQLSLFKSIAVNAKRVCKTYDKTNVNIFKVLDNIIPIDFFGTKKNRKIFNKIVNIFLTRADNECISAQKIISGYNIAEIPWLKSIKETFLRRRYLYKGVIWLLEKIVRPIGYHLYYVMKKTNTRDIAYYPRYAWSSFKQKALHKLKEDQQIVPADNVDTECVIGILNIMPKGTLTRLTSFRPIIKTKRRKASYKPLLRFIKQHIQQICRTQTGDIYLSWKNYVEKTKNKKIYAIKVDVSNGYSNTNLEFLEEKIQASRNIPPHYKKILLNYMNNQYVEIPIKSKPAKIYKWTKGLIQGGQLSGALFNLFMCYVDKLYLDNFYKKDWLIHRVVDDYFFCSTKIDDVKWFLHRMQIAHVLNMDKLMSNIEPFNDTKIIYCGKVFNLDNNEIVAHYQFDTTGYMHHKYKIWDHKQVLSKEAVLTKAMLYRYNCFHFNKVELNTYFNSEATVMHNFFHAMILLAFKFHNAVYTIHSYKDMELYGHIITQTVWYFSYRVLKNICRVKGKLFNNNITFGLLLKVSYSAFKIVLERRYKMYKSLILEIRKCLKNIKVRNWMELGSKLNIRTMPNSLNNIRVSRKLIILNA